MLRMEYVRQHVALRFKEFLRLFAVSEPSRVRISGRRKSGGDSRSKMEALMIQNKEPLISTCNALKPKCHLGFAKAGPRSAFDCVLWFAQDETCSSLWDALDLDMRRSCFPARARPGQCRKDTGDGHEGGGLEGGGGRLSALRRVVRVYVRDVRVGSLMQYKIS